ncbi:MAG: synthase sector subunit b [Labilithrix sp.]|nr:synthase sector subunit b [Labilithrix sp.]
MSRHSIVSRARIVSAVVLFAFAGLTTAAFAQDHHPDTASEIHKQPGTETPSAVGGGHTEHGEHVENGGEHGAHAGGHHGPEPINWADIWDSKRPAVLALLINFGVLVAAYYMLGKKPVSDALKQRRVTIGKDIDEAQKLLDEALERAKKYQGSLQTADADAATAKASLIAAGSGEVERLLNDTTEKAERMKRDAERLVEQERKGLRETILRETIELAGDEAAVILAQSVNADDHARLANDLLLELQRRPAHSAATYGATS